MDYAWVIVKVVYRTQQLFKIVPGKLFIETTSGILHLYIREKVSLLN